MSGIGLTQEQASAVKYTWSFAERDLKHHGVQIFIRLFTKYPHIQQLFKSVKDTPVHLLDRKPAMKAHAVGVMKEFSGYVDYIEDTDLLVAAIEGNAVRHYGRKVTVSDYEALMELVHDYLQEELGEEFSQAASDGWKTVGAVLATTIAKQYAAMATDSSSWGWLTSWCTFL